MDRKEKDSLSDEVRELFTLADEMLDSQSESGSAFGGHDIHDRLIMSSLIAQTRLTRMAGGGAKMQEMAAQALEAMKGTSAAGPQPAQPLPPPERRPGNPVRPKIRFPKFSMGAEIHGLVSDGQGGGATWLVHAVYADYWAAVDSFVVPPGWFESQVESEVKPRTKDQIFYGLCRHDGMGAILVGENELLPHGSPE
jgi:hypothetical protein